MTLEIALLDETELAHAVEDGYKASTCKPELKRRTRNPYQTPAGHDDFCMCVECI